MPRTSLPYLSSINRDEFHTTPSHAFTFSRSSSFSNEKQQHFNIPQKKGRFYRSVSDTPKQNRAETKMTSRKDTPMKPKRVYEKRDPKKIIDDLGKFRSKRKDATRKKTNTEDSKIVFNNFSITETDWKEVFKNTVKNPGIVLKSPQSLLKSKEGHLFMFVCFVCSFVCFIRWFFRSFFRLFVFLISMRYTHCKFLNCLKQILRTFDSLVLHGPIK